MRAKSSSSSLAKADPEPETEDELTPRKAAPSEPSISRLIGSRDDTLGFNHEILSTRATTERTTAMQIARELRPISAPVVDDATSAWAEEPKSAGHGTVKAATMAWAGAATRDAPIPPAASAASTIRGSAVKEWTGAATRDAPAPPRAASRSRSGTVTAKPPADSLEQSTLGPVPSFDLSAFSQPLSLSLGIKGTPISTEIISLTASSTKPLSKDADVFYDMEVIAIVHRHKDSGLANTTCFAWHGRNAVSTETVAQRLEALASRYRVQPTDIAQGSEPAALVALLGGKLVTRSVRL